MKQRLILFLFLMTTVSAMTGQNQILTPELLWQIGRVGLDAVSPDGQWAVYGVQRYDMATNKGTRVLYLVDVASGDTRALTEPDQTCSDAEFHPSGERIGYLREGKLYEIKISGRAVTALVSDLEMNGFHYAPNGQSIVMARDVQLDPSAIDKNPDLPATTGKVIDGLFYRHWKTWRDGKYSNLFIAPYTDGTLGAMVNIMNERFDTPIPPDGGMEQVTWSPDSRFVVYASRKLNGTTEAQSTNADLWLYDVVAGKTMNATPDLPGYDLDPSFSPDGRYLAWTSMARAGNESDRSRLMVLNTSTQERTELTTAWDFEAKSPQWATDSKSLYFLSAENFTYQLYQITVADRKIRRITEGQHDYTALKVGRELLATRHSMAAPAELYAVNPQTGVARALSDATSKPWADLAKGKVERRMVKTVDGKDLNVWMIFPPDFDPQKKYPTILYCQGGPQSSLSQFFSYRWNFQLMAANGYIVVAPSRRGMPGAGTYWNDQVSGDWGGLAMQDLLSATDYAAKLPYVDARRIAAAGASFGGFSVYWLAGNHQKRFRAFISHCGIFNLESFYSSTEELWFADNDLGGAPWKTPQPPSYQKFSPHLFVNNWDTPLLVIHNQLDFRIPVTEGMQAFQAAQLRGIPSQFLYFADEGHHVTKPQNSLLWQRTFFNWLDKWMKP